MTPEKVLEVRGLRKRYAGVIALSGVDMDLAEGEIHALVGENGAGKSTLVKCLSGAVEADGGEILLRGRPVSIRHPHDSSRIGLSFIHQELNLVPYLDARENIFLGHPYPLRAGIFVDWKALTIATKDILRELGVDFPVTVPVSALSGGDRAFTAVARAFAVAADVYFMDEPATALTDTEKKSFFDLLLRLKAQGKTIVLVSHNLDDMLRFSDRVTVLKDGAVAGSWRTAELTKNELISRMIGKPGETAAALKKPEPRAEKPAETALFAGKGIRTRKLSGIDLEIRSGEILGIGGLAGSGRTELLRVLFGLRKLSAGTMELGRARWAPKSPTEAIRGGIALVPEDRRRQGLVMTASVADNMALTALDRWTVLGLVRRGALRRSCGQARADVRLKAPDLSAKVGTLSGGNQQKVVFAKAFLKEPRLLILDEPTQGVDVGARAELYELIRGAAARGTAVVIASSDSAEMLALCNRILFLKNGAAVATVSAAELDEETYLHYCYGRIPS